jgi:hypothetical protein
VVLQWRPVYLLSAENHLESIKSLPNGDVTFFVTEETDTIEMRRLFYDCNIIDDVYVTNYFIVEDLEDFKKYISSPLPLIRIYPNVGNGQEKLDKVIEIIHPNKNDVELVLQEIHNSLNSNVK